MPEIGRYKTVRELSSTLTTTLWLANDPRDVSEVAIKHFRPDPAIVGVAGAKEAAEAFLRRAALQQHLSASDPSGWAAVHESGLWADGAYCVMPHYPRSAQKLIWGKVRLQADELHALTSAVLTALADMPHESAGHGNLKPSNILIGAGRTLAESPLVLTDPADPRQSQRRKHDLPALGQLIYRLVVQPSGARAIAWPLASDPAWDALGARGEGWRDLCGMLLRSVDPDQPADMDDVRSRLAALAEQPRAPHIPQEIVARTVSQVRPISMQIVRRGSASFAAGCRAAAQGWKTARPVLIDAGRRTGILSGQLAVRTAHTAVHVAQGTRRVALPALRKAAVDLIAFVREHRRTAQPAPMVAGGRVTAVNREAVEVLAAASPPVQAVEVHAGPNPLAPIPLPSLSEPVDSTAGRDCQREVRRDLIEQYDVAISAAPTDAALHQARAIAYFRKGELDRAATDFNRAIQLDPSGAEAFRHRGALHESRGEFIFAISDYAEAVRLDPGMAEAHEGRGRAYAALSRTAHGIRRQENCTQAIASFTEAARLYATLSRSGRGAEQREKCEGAIRCFTEALRLDPTQIEALLERAATHRRLALADYDDAFAVNPQEAAAYIAQARASGNASRGVARRPE